MIDPNIQAPGQTWGTRVGADIGGTPPSSYEISQGVPSSATAAIFRTSGEPYSDWLAYSSRWVPPNVFSCVMSFDLWLDQWVASRAQALEFDWKANIGGFMFNLSGQININAGWVWQVDLGGKWASAVSIGAIQPNSRYEIAIASKFDTVAHTYSPLSIAVDSKTFLVPVSLQNQPAQSITPQEWALGVCNVQIQQDANSVGGPFQTQIDNLCLTWS